MATPQEFVHDAPYALDEQTRFQYEGHDILGNPTKMHVYAHNETDAHRKLTEARIEVATITPKPPRLGRRKRVLSRDELGTFAIQLSERTAASEPIPQAIFEMSRATNNPLLREALSDVFDQIKTESLNIHDAFATRSDVFPETFQHIIRVGTKKGDPSDMLNRYGRRQLLTSANIAKITGALIYPAVVLAFASLIVLALVLYILPQMSDMYNALLSASSGNKQLPLLTRALLGASNFLLSYPGLFTMLLVVVLIVVGSRWLKTPGGRDWFQRHSIRWPYIGPLLRQFNAAHVVDLMAILSPVLTPTEFLQEASAASLNVVYRETLDAIRESFRAGALDLTTAFGPYSYLFGDDFQAAVGTGEQTGRLPDQLKSYAELLDRRVQESTARLSKLVEPATLVISGLVIGLIVVAAYWPLFQLVGDMANAH